MQEIKLIEAELRERLSSDTIKLMDLAEQAGRVALASREKGLVSNDIHLSGFVSSGDLDVDTFVHAKAKIDFPQAAILSEETHAEFAPEKSQDVLIVDPIDGTRWYKDGGDVWSTVLCLIKEGQPKSAAIFQPDLRVLTFAERGVGAFCQKDGKIYQIKTNPETDLLKSKVGLGAVMANPETRAQIAGLAGQVIIQSRGPYVIESSGYELSCLARGVGFSGYVHPHAPPWDRVAGIFLVNMAGGKATAWPGQDDIFGKGIIAAANPELYENIKELAMKHVG